MPLAVCRDAPGTGQSGPAVILGALLSGAHDQFELRPGTLCRRVLMSGDRAVGVDLVDLASARMYQIAADHVVVAADSLRTPQLLFSSGVRPAALGRHLNEHPFLSALLKLDEPTYELGDAELDALMPASGVTWVPYDGDHFPMHVQLHQWSDLLAVGIFLPKEIDWRSRVEFSDAVLDWRGLPSMRVHHSLSDADRAVVDEAGEVMAAIARACAGSLLDDRPRLMPAGTSLHYQGTVRMGAEDDGSSVCDRHSRVWGTENLYVAGNGVIPTSTACNPTLTSVALAVLGAHQVAGRVAGRSAAVG
jgi:choline dehydrogenase-like flavoprotein